MRLFICAALLALCACDEQGAAADPAGEIKVAYRKAVTVAASGLSIEFTELAEDSRCPSDTQCFSAGNARIVVTASKPGQGAASYELNTTTGTSTAQYSGDSIRLKSLAPSRTANRQPPASDYIATFEVNR